MGLFGFGKKKEEKCGCCCTENAVATNMDSAKKVQPHNAMVKILGSGCAKCNALEGATKEALEQMGITSGIDHITDFAQIAAYGVMTTPALVVGEKVVSYGKVLKTQEVIEILEKEFVKGVDR